MKFVTTLVRDTSNSYPDEAELEVSREVLVLRLRAPDREVWIRLEDLERAVPALRGEGRP